MDGNTKAATSNPLIRLQAMLVEKNAKPDATDQEKADWIGCYVDQMNPKVISDLYSGRGSAPNPPSQMFKLMLYQLLKQNLSPSKWSREISSDAILRHLIGFIEPSRTSLYNFRDRIGVVMEEINRSLLAESMEQLALSFSDVAMDGTSVRSFGSRHRIVNEKTISRRKQELGAALARDVLGETHPDLPSWMGKTKSGRAGQLANYEYAKTILTQRIEENAMKKKSFESPSKRFSLASPILKQPSHGIKRTSSARCIMSN